MPAAPACRIVIVRQTSHSFTYGIHRERMTDGLLQQTPSVHGSIVFRENQKNSFSRNRNACVDCEGCCVRGLPRSAGEGADILSAHRQGIRIHRKRQSGNSGKVRLELALSTIRIKRKRSLEPVMAVYFEKMKKIHFLETELPHAISEKTCSRLRMRLMPTGITPKACSCLSANSGF